MKEKYSLMCKQWHFLSLCPSILLIYFRLFWFQLDKDSVLCPSLWISPCRWLFSLSIKRGDWRGKLLSACVTSALDQLNNLLPQEGATPPSPQLCASPSVKCISCWSWCLVCPCICRCLYKHTGYKQLHGKRGSLWCGTFEFSKDFWTTWDENRSWLT